MIKGLLLGFSIATFLTSLGIIFAGFRGGIRQTLITGAVTGSQGIIPMAFIGLVFSFVALFFLVLILKNPYKEVN